MLDKTIVGLGYIIDEQKVFKPCNEHNQECAIRK